MKKPYTAPEKNEKADKEKRSAKDEAMRYLEYRMHTAFEVKKHLEQKEYPEEEIEECMEFLEECRFVNDRDYCVHYIEYSIEKGRGPQRIRQELAQKGVDGELADEELAELYDGQTQREMAMKQAEKALGRNNRFAWSAGREGYGLPGSGAEDQKEQEEDGIAEDPDSALEPPSEKELARTARRLAGLGYGASVVYEVLSRLRG